MGRNEKLILKLLSGSRDSDFSFSELQKAVSLLGFRLDRISGDHHIYVHGEILEIINLQPAGNGKAKPYQVRQVREIANRYGLFGGVAE